MKVQPTIILNDVIVDLAGERALPHAHSNNPAETDMAPNLIAAHVRQGNVDEASSIAARLLEVAPAFSVAAFAQMNLFRQQSMAALVASLRQAGSLPE